MIFTSSQMLWLIVGILAWLLGGFVAAGWLRATEVRHAPYTTDGSISSAWWMLIPIALGPMIMIITLTYFSHNGWMAPWRSK